MLGIAGSANGVLRNRSSLGLLVRLLGWIRSNLPKTMTEVALAYIFDAQGSGAHCQAAPEVSTWAVTGNFPAASWNRASRRLQAIQREILEELAICGRLRHTYCLGAFCTARVAPELAFFPVVCQWLARRHSAFGTR